jgi:hypothetical protein
MAAAALELALNVTSGTYECLRRGLVMIVSAALVAHLATTHQLDRDSAGTAQPLAFQRQIAKYKLDMRDARAERP